MIEKDKIIKLVAEYTDGTDIFPVEVRVSSSNRIMVSVDTMKGIGIDECAALHRHIEKHLDRNIEDYELLVSSPGIDMPFAVPEQYHKNEGKQVQVIDKGGSRYIGILKNVTKGGFEIETELKIKGKKKEKKEISFNFDQIKSTKEIISFK